VDVWVDGVGARKEKERETERQNARWGESAGEGRGGGPRDSPLSLSLSLSLSAQKTDTGGSRLFHSPFSFTYCPPGRGTSLGGGSGWLAGCGKDGKEEKERECEREPVPKTG